jgi:hypothetical protein
VPSRSLEQAVPAGDQADCQRWQPIISALVPSAFDRDVAGRHCIGSLPTDTAVSWLTMQSAAN